MSLRVRSSAPVASKATKAVRPVARLAVRAQAQQPKAQVAKLAAGTFAAAATLATVATPIAEAAVTPSLQNFIYSLVAGGGAWRSSHPSTAYALYWQ